jgi:O-acetyl-ADP-ribose deacetylase (regulator of RNase III)
VLTRGYKLPATWVIHTVGPVWEGGHYDEDGVLASCYERTLKLAADHGIRSIAFPAISTGVYGFPVARATAVAVASASRTLAALPAIEEVRFVCFDRGVLRLYQRELTRGL